MQCHAMQFTLLEEFGTSGNPAAQFLGTVDSTSPANLLGIKQLWMSPVSASLHATSTAMPCPVCCGCTPLVLLLQRCVA